MITTDVLREAFVFPAFLLGSRKWPAARCATRAVSVSTCFRTLKMTDGGVRVNKVLQSRYSRREADAMVAAGRILVNGKRALPGLRVHEQDCVSVDGREFVLPARTFLAAHDVSSDRSTFVYFKYWKPYGVTCTCDQEVPDNILDASGLYTGSRMLKNRVFNVGRLDKDSTGLILLTDDGRAPNALLRKDFARNKRYHVVLDREISDQELQSIRRGVEIKTEAKYDRTVKVVRSRTLPCEVQRSPHSDGRTLLMTLCEGRNRQIRKMFGSLGHTVLSLHRDLFCGIRLSPELRRAGDLAPLSARERKIVQDAIAAWSADTTPRSSHVYRSMGGSIETRPRYERKRIRTWRVSSQRDRDAAEIQTRKK